MTQPQLWGGRFNKELSDVAKAFSYSLSFDQVLLPYDIAVNKAHVLGLRKAGVLTETEKNTLHHALEAVLTEANKALTPLPDDEDIHGFVERMVVQKVGDLGKKMHTGKSRNDQVATDIRLYIKHHISEINALIHQTLQALIEMADVHKKTIFPGFTHLQIAQPVVFAHHILAYIEKLKRDKARFVQAFERADVCPLGSAAMAGPNYNLDRLMVAQELGFSDITLNSMDAVSDRDFMFDFLYAASMTTLHLSQFCEELIFWSSSVVGFIRIGDEFTTGSSIMPQKKNPDIAELIRGQAGPVVGQFMGLHEMVKGLPLTYNRDLQNDKLLLFQAVDITTSVLRCFSKMIPTIEVHEASIQDAMMSGHILATELADYLSQKGMPFRDAHHVVGQMVQHADSVKKQVHELSIQELQKFSSLVELDVLDRLSFKSAINQKQGIGSTSFSEIEKQLSHLKEAFEC